MEMNRQGIVRTLEAALAILMLLGFIYFIIPEPTTATGQIPYEVRESESFVLQEIAFDDDLRQCIFNAPLGQCSFITPSCSAILSLIEQNTPAGYTYACEICNTALTCEDGRNLGLPSEKTIYTDSIFLTKEKTSRILRVYFYEKV